MYPSDDIGTDPDFSQSRRKGRRQPDRRQAIKTAVKMAQKGDIILLAGKGHEKYQDINGIKHPFDDKEEVLKAF